MTAMLDTLGLSFVAPSEGFQPDDEIDFSALDEGSLADEELPRDPKVPYCEVCDKEIPWAGRGRKPLMHKECRAALKAGASTDGAVSTGKSRSPIKKLKEDLLSGTGTATTVLMPFAPVTAMTLALQCDKGYDSLIKVALDLERRGHPGMLNGMFIAAAITPWVDVAGFLGAFIYAVGVDAGQLSPDTIVARKLGVTEAAMQVGWENPRHSVPVEFVPTTADGAFGVPPPPSFTRVG